MDASDKRTRSTRWVVVAFDLGGGVRGEERVRAPNEFFEIPCSSSSYPKKNEYLSDWVGREVRTTISLGFWRGVCGILGSDFWCGEGVDGDVLLFRDWS